MNILNELQTAQVEALYKKYGRTEISRSEINDFVKSGEISNPSWLKNKNYLVSRGVYSLPVAIASGISWTLVQFETTSPLT